MVHVATSSENPVPYPTSTHTRTRKRATVYMFETPAGETPHLRQSVRPSFLSVEHFPCPTLGIFPRTPTHSTDSLKRLSPCLHSPPSLSVHTTHVTPLTHAHTYAHTLWHTHTGQDTIRCSEFDKSIQDLLSRTQGVCSAGRSLCLMLVSVCVHVCVCVYL